MVRKIAAPMAVLAGAVALIASAGATVKPIANVGQGQYSEFCSGPIRGVALQGDDAPDKVVGTPNSDLVLGGGGNDRIGGVPGNDCLFGQAGDDRMKGGKNNDLMAGGADDDHVNGGIGNDLIRLQNGNDRAYGGAGRDFIKAQGKGKDRVNCGRGKDKTVVDKRDRVLKNCEKVKVVKH
jgi:Ca2+-binding RTX toxin-like protein